MLDVRIDSEALDAIDSDLRAITAEFENAGDFSDRVASLVGHDGLADTVEDFADKWNIRRDELFEKLIQIQATVVAIRDTFAELDAAFAGGLDPATNPDGTVNA